MGDGCEKQDDLLRLPRGVLRGLDRLMLSLFHEFQQYRMARPCHEP